MGRVQLAEPVAPPFAIRRATIADCATITDQRVAMLREIGTLAEQDAALLRRSFLSWLEHALPSCEYHGWLATVPAGDGRDAVVAGAGMLLRRMPPRPDPRGGVMEGLEGLVVNVWTDHAWRRRGLAEALVRRALADSDALGARRVMLHASHAGRPLYERLGFEASSEMMWKGFPD